MKVLAGGAGNPTCRGMAFSGAAMPGASSERADRQGRRSHREYGGHGPPYLKSTTITAGHVRFCDPPPTNLEFLGKGPGNTFLHKKGFPGGLLSAPSEKGISTIPFLDGKRHSVPKLTSDI